MATVNYDPNARYDNGPNAAGSNGVPPNLPADGTYRPGLSTPRDPGLMHDYTLNLATQRAGFSAAGAFRDNGGPNVAGRPRGIGITATAS